MARKRFNQIFLIIFIIVGAAIFLKGFSNKDKGTEISATISRIEKKSERVRRDGHYETRIEHIVYIDYEYNGQPYTNVKYNNYQSTMDEGETIKIRIDENNPTTIYYSTSNMILGIGMMVCSAIMFFIVTKYSKDKSVDMI